MAGEAALTRSMLVRFQPPEHSRRLHSSVAKRKGARLLIGILQVRFLPLELGPYRTPASSPDSQSGKPRAALGGVTALHRPVRLAARMRLFQCCEAGSTPARDAIVSSGCSSAGRALVSGARGRRFKPCHPDHSAFRPTARTLARLARDEGSNPSGRTANGVGSSMAERAAVAREMRVRSSSITPFSFCSPTPLVRRSVCPTEPGGFDSHGERFAPLA